MPKHFRMSIMPLSVTLGLLILLAILIRIQLATIESIPASAGEAVFSAERAFTMLQKLNPDEQPHPVDSKANRVVEQRLIKQLRQLGYQEEIQDTPICEDSNYGRAVCTRVRNIIVSIPGTSDDPGILLSAHYDSVPAGPGASDAGAAVGTLLEIARLLSNQPPPRNRIVLLFNEGEELGLFGAKAFMRYHPLAKSLKLAINIEARGSSGKSVMFETGENSGWLVNYYAQTTPAALSSSLFYEVYKYLPNDTDLTVFKKFGLQGLNFAHAEREPHYHTPLDNFKNLDKGSLQHHGDNVWGVVKSIKDIDLTQAEKGNLIYTDVMGLFVIKWAEPFSLTISIALMLILGIACWRIQQIQSFRFRGFLISAAGFVFVIVISMLVGLAMQKLVQMLSSNNQPWYANSFPMQVCVWSAVACCGLVCLRLLVKNRNVINLLVTLNILWLVFAVISSILMPGISFLFILPGSVATFCLSLLPLLIRRFGERVVSIIAVVLAIVVAIIFMPVVYVLQIMLSYSLTIAIGLILGFIISALMPLVVINAKAVRAFTLIVLGLFFISLSTAMWTSFQAPYSAWMPQELNIVHYQGAQNKSYIVASEASGQLPQPLAKAMGEVKLGTIFPWSSKVYFYAETQSLDLPPPEISVIEQVKNEQGRNIKVKLSASDNFLSDIRLYIPAESGLKTIKAFDELLSFENEKNFRNGYYEFFCRGDSCANFELTLNLEKQSPVSILVVKYLRGLPTIEQSLKIDRGNKATARQEGDQTLVVSQVEI